MRGLACRFPTDLVGQKASSWCRRKQSFHREGIVFYKMGAFLMCCHLKPLQDRKKIITCYHNMLTTMTVLAGQALYMEHYFKGVVCRCHNTQ